MTLARATCFLLAFRSRAIASKRFRSSGVTVMTTPALILRAWSACPRLGILRTPQAQETREARPVSVRAHLAVRDPDSESQRLTRCGPPHYVLTTHPAHRSRQLVAYGVQYGPDERGEGRSPGQHDKRLRGAAARRKAAPEPGQQSPERKTRSRARDRELPGRRAARHRCCHDEGAAALFRPQRG